MANERPEMLDKSSTLYFGPWYRMSPFFDATLSAGCTAYDIYNHMYLPAYYDDPDVEYWALVNGVTMWDVGVERTVEVTGKDADALVDYITCRDLTRCAVGQGKYMPVLAPDGGIVNDPVLLHVGERKWWMQLADSDAGLYALGVAAGRFDVDITLPDVHPMQVQGPLAAKTLEKLVGSSIYDIKYYWLAQMEIEGIPSAERVGPQSPVSKSTCSTGRWETNCGTRSRPRERSSASDRSPRARLGGSKPGSSTTART